ncbi:hypothetical protein [Corynebacterium freiburgense]|uniref:hypothetical protein n=1 Tax=Corynebacterium freiburgense TaxID=556548 RepID=UPI0004003301|nr:hypothetical protein [Corynebacterium freiburgense]WJZ03711.1 hypothetical protein CFREI_12270 [Corynebacterium freiburgense]
MSSLTVFVGRGSLAAGIRQTLEDLAALNLVGDYIWVDADTFTSSASMTSCAVTAPDGTTTVQQMPLNEALTRSRAERLMVGVINDVSTPQGTMSSENLAPFIEAIDAVRIGQRAQRANLMIAAVNTPTAGELPILRGYINLMLAPEDSIGPEATPISYVHERLTSKFVLHCATGIASLFGIWEGHSKAPVARMEPGHGETFRLVRTFYRRIDGQEVQQKLKERIFDIKRNPLPILPHSGRKVTAQYTNDHRTMNAECAEELIQEYLPLLKGPRSQGSGELTRLQTNSGAASEYFGRFGKNLLSAPVRWFRNSSDELSNLTSQAIQSSLYGTDSRVQVGSGPVLGAENPRQIVEQRMNREQVAREYAPLWQSYENMAMTMVDAKPRPFGQSNLPRYPKAVAQGETEPVYVVPDAQVVIPGPRVRFGNDLPPQLKAMLNMDSIASYDLMEAERYERTLSQQSNIQHRDIGRIIGEFGQWRNTHSDSFAANVSRRLGSTVRDLEAEAQSWKQRAEQLRNQRQEGPKTAALLIGILRWLGYVTFWSWAAFIGMWLAFRGDVNEQGLPVYQWVRAFEMSAASTKSTFLVVWFVLWMVLFFTQIALETRDEIRILNRRRTLVSEIEAAEKNYFTCVEAQERIRTGYHQFVAISHQLGAVMEQPFGTVRQYRVEGVIPVNDMPASVVLAEANPDEAVIENVARRFRENLYHQGWMQSHVQEARGAATAQLEQQEGIPIRTENMHALTGRGTGTALDRMAHLMSSPQYNFVDRSTDEWNAITKQLKDVVRIERGDILQPVQISRGGEKTQVPKLQQLSSSVHQGSFNAEFITEAGRVHGVETVDRFFLQEGGSELDAIGVSEVLVQIGRPARAGDIRVITPQRIKVEPQNAPVPPTSDDDWAIPQDYQMPRVNKQDMPGEGEF